MKTRALLWRAAFAAVVVSVAVGRSPGGSFFAPVQSITLDGRLNCPSLLEQGGTAYLQLVVRTPQSERRDRRPMNLAVVLDRSGSMGSERKIENARAAVRSLVDQLRSDDILSLVIYDDVVEVLRPACRVGDREAVKRLIDEVAPRGWTNLGGGLEEGFRQAQSGKRHGFVNRVILLSDGLANRGVTDPGELARLTRCFRNESISLSTVGVGLEYNEYLMTALADAGGGNYYFVEQAHHLASIFRKEFSGLSTLVAQNASIDLTLRDGVRIVDVIGGEQLSEGSRSTITLGDLYAADQREVTVALHVPPGHGRRTIATAALRYTVEDRGTLFSNSVTVGIRYTHDRAEVERQRDKDVQARADVAASTRGVEEALQSLDKGDRGAALNALEEVRKELAASPAAAAGGKAGEVIREQEAKLKAFSDTLVQSDGNVARVKKSIQFENYRTQKKR